MSPLRDHLRAALLGLALLLQAGTAWASREGEGLVDAVRLIVFALLAALFVTVSGGVFLGVRKAVQSGESLLKGFATGLGKGLLAFVVTVAAGTVVLTVLRALWIGWSLFSVHVLGWYQ